MHIQEKIKFKKLQNIVRKASSFRIILCLQFIMIHHPEVVSLLLVGKNSCKNSTALNNLLNYRVVFQDMDQTNKTMS